MIQKLKNLWSSYNNLNFDKSIIEQCRSQMNEDNLQTMEHVSCLMMIIISILLFFYILFDNDLLRNIVCFVVMAIMFGLFLISRNFKNNPQKITNLSTDLLIDFFSIICFVAATYLGTFAAGDEMAVPAVWMFFFAVLIFNRLPIQNLIVVLCAFLIFISCSYVTKRPYIFYYDVVHAITSIVAAIFMSWTKSRMKVENVLSYMRLQYANIEIMETVEEQQREAALLRHKASRDELTGLYKKNYFEEKVKEKLSTACQGEIHALVCLDLDNFKDINDKLGHMFGDEVLKQTSIIMRLVSSKDDLACRFGGDEFCIFFSNINLHEDLGNKLQLLLDKAKTECQIENTQFPISISIGGAFYTQNGCSFKELFEQADKALYRAKSMGKGKYCIAS